MPVQPIDLQTLFTQMEKVGKNEAAQKEGAQLQAAVQNARIQQKTTEKDHAVNEAQDTGEGGADRVKDRNGRGNSGAGLWSRGKKDQGQGEAGAEFIQDPDLGRNIDVSG